MYVLFSTYPLISSFVKAGNLQFSFVKAIYMYGFIAFQGDGVVSTPVHLFIPASLTESERLTFSSSSNC
jgi:hypothetical protein